MHVLKRKTDPHPHTTARSHTNTNWKHHQKLRVHVECDPCKWEASGELTASGAHQTRDSSASQATLVSLSVSTSYVLYEMINLAGVRWVSPTVLASCRLQSAGSTEGQPGRLMAAVTKLEAGPLEEAAIIRTNTLSNNLTCWSHAVY